MSFFDQSSLCLIPSGYKDQKLYAVKPLDGSGDLTFSRASSATRVASNGLIEKVRTNLALYSEDLTNAAWTNFSITVSANAGTAPNGTTTADKLIPTTSSTNHLIHTNQITSAGEYSFSVYVKASGYSKVAIRESWTSGDYTSFDLTTATVIDSAGSYTNTITSVGNGWYRVTCTKSFTGDIALGIIPLLDSYTGGSPLTAYAGNGTSGVLAWGAQMEFGVTTDYIATTSAAVSVGPVSGLPRLDYLNSTCPRLLLEPQRTNSVTYSEQFDNAAWQKTAAGTGVAPAVTANYATSPSGYQDADLVVFNRGAGNTSSDFSWIYQNFVTSAATYTISCYVKAATSADVGKNLAWRNFGGGAAWDVTLTNEWQRISVQATGSGTTQEVGFYNRGSYTSANSVSVLMWGFQAEVGAYATSYIPTLGTSVTRVADAASKTGISSLLGQTEGTIFAEVDFDAAVNTEGYIFRIDESSFNDTVFVSRGDDKILNGVLRAAGSTIVQLQKTAFNGVNKLAFAYKSGSFALYVNGTQIATSAATYTNGITYDDIRIGGYNATTANMCGGIKQLLLFTTRLSNSDLAALTA